MRRLAPNLFDRRFDQLLEAGRSRLPSRAPGWTDYNTHDPGITLMELLAFVTEAQLYSLGRMRRDEREGYAALLGLRRQGPAPAAGTLWPDRADPDSPFLTYQQAIIVEADAEVRTTTNDTLLFQPTHRILWTAGNITALRTLTGGRDIDLTQVNEQGDRAFEPFGASASSADVLRLEYRTLGDRGLFPEKRALAANAAWPIGVRVAPALRAVEPDHTTPPATPLSVEMRLGTERIDLPVVSDGTRGFMQSGVLLLDLSAVPGSPAQFAIEIRASRGFARAPRILALQPGVLPIVQGGSERNQAHVTTGLPGQRIDLAVPGLRFGDGLPGPRVVIEEDAERRDWRPVADLAKAGPGDLVYELDTATESIYLGNGINGHLPEADCPIAIDYAYCSGAAGNLPRRQRWQVRGISGTFGVNTDAITGGSDAETDLDLRRQARARLRDAHALVTVQDLENAALNLPDLEVARAEVSVGRPHPDATRTLTLLALRARTTTDEPAEAPETSRWLAAVRRGLARRLPLGTRLVVRAPDYQAFTLAARIEALPRRNPEEIQKAIRERLRDAFVLTPRAGLEPRHFGAPVTPRDLAALIRKVPGVRRVISLALDVDGKAVDVLKLHRRALPRIDLSATEITVERSGPGGTP